MKKDSSEQEAENIRRSLALRMELYFPIVSAAVMNATPHLEEGGTLVLTYPADFRLSYELAKQMELGMRHFCDCGIRVERVRAP